VTNRAKGRVPPQLALCHACKSFVKPEEVACPHCGEDIAMAAVRNADRMEQLDQAMKELRGLLEGLGVSTSASGGPTGA
jgi:predicted amidophosphoribosyltransferase